MLTEVCIQSVADLRAANAGGADRVELCQALELGGLTPSAGLLDAAIYLLPTHVLIRPRAGDFVYDSRETRVMAKDIEDAIDKGADSVVFGALTETADIHTEAMHRLMGAAGDVPVTFHRAFDSVRDPLRALDDLIELGVDRLLTSGRAVRAVDGVELLAELVRRAGDDLVILAGAGINPDNAASVVAATGVREIHFSARRKVAARAGVLPLGPGDHGDRWETDPDLVRQIVAAVADS